MVLYTQINTCILFLFFTHKFYHHSFLGWSGWSHDSYEYSTANVLSLVMRENS
ncbi:hypothetical protein HanPI659440_Chr12g0479351 [Helianthus annuus]|nr:hypothetical protein HanPI659440_Chr12g0479351 [Helianthus annuus]